MDYRPVFFRNFIGYNRTGKTSIAQYYANLWRINNPEGTIVGYDPQRRFQHLIDPKYRIKAGEKKWWKKIEHLRNALFIGDDYRGINRPNTTSDDFYALCEFRAEYGIDIILVCHSPALVLAGLTTYISHYHIFYTKGIDAKFESRMDNYFECQAANQIMRDYKDAYPEIVEAPKQFYDEVTFKHRFPHVIVDTNAPSSQKMLIPQNMNPQWLNKNWGKYMIELQNEE
ncbi:hypothetical protein JYU20_00630 [Bacteroidales bacterium AH-315-I05]|nr:hypothetical protein [Bacteroidales bacterium AH-315-I05]